MIASVFTLALTFAWMQHAPYSGNDMKLRAHEPSREAHLFSDADTMKKQWSHSNVRHSDATKPHAFRTRSGDQDTLSLAKQAERRGYNLGAGACVRADGYSIQDGADKETSRTSNATACEAMCWAKKTCMGYHFHRSLRVCSQYVTFPLKAVSGYPVSAEGKWYLNSQNSCIVKSTSLSAQWPLYPVPQVGDSCPSPLNDPTNVYTYFSGVIIARDDGATTTDTGIVTTCAVCAQRCSQKSESACRAYTCSGANGRCYLHRNPVPTHAATTGGRKNHAHSSRHACARATAVQSTRCATNYVRRSGWRYLSERSAVFFSEHNNGKKPNGTEFLSLGAHANAVSHRPSSTGCGWCSAKCDSDATCKAYQCADTLSSFCYLFSSSTVSSAFSLRDVSFCEKMPTAQCSVTNGLVVTSAVRCLCGSGSTAAVCHAKSYERCLVTVNDHGDRVGKCIVAPSGCGTSEVRVHRFALGANDAEQCQCVRASDACFQKTAANGFEMTCAHSTTCEHQKYPCQVPGCKNKPQMAGKWCIVCDGKMITVESECEAHCHGTGCKILHRGRCGDRNDCCARSYGGPCTESDVVCSVNDKTYYSTCDLRNDPGEQLQHRGPCVPKCTAGGETDCTCENDDGTASEFCSGQLYCAALFDSSSGKVCKKRCSAWSTNCICRIRSDSTVFCGQSTFCPSRVIADARDLSACLQQCNNAATTNGDCFCSTGNVCSGQTEVCVDGGCKRVCANPGDTDCVCNVTGSGEFVVCSAGDSMACSADGLQAGAGCVAFCATNVPQTNCMCRTSRSDSGSGDFLYCPLNTFCDVEHVTDATCASLCTGRGKTDCLCRNSDETTGVDTFSWCAHTGETTTALYCTGSNALIIPFRSSHNYADDTPSTCAVICPSFGTRCLCTTAGNTNYANAAICIDDTYCNRATGQCDTGCVENAVVETNNSTCTCGYDFAVQNPVQCQNGAICIKDVRNGTTSMPKCLSTVPALCGRHPNNVTNIQETNGQAVHSGYDGDDGQICRCGADSGVHCSVGTYCVELWGECLADAITDCATCSSAEKTHATTASAMSSPCLCGGTGGEICPRSDICSAEEDCVRPAPPCRKPDKLPLGYTLVSGKVEGITPPMFVPVSGENAPISGYQCAEPDFTLPTNGRITYSCGIKPGLQGDGDVYSLHGCAVDCRADSAQARGERCNGCGASCGEKLCVAGSGNLSFTGGCCGGTCAVNCANYPKGEKCAECGNGIGGTPCILPDGNGNGLCSPDGYCTGKCANTQGHQDAKCYCGDIDEKNKICGDGVGTCASTTGDGPRDTCVIDCTSVEARSRCPACGDYMSGPCKAPNDVTGVCGVDASGISHCVVNCASVDATGTCAGCTNNADGMCTLPGGNKGTCITVNGVDMCVVQCTSGERTCPECSDNTNAHCVSGTNDTTPGICAVNADADAVCAVKCATAVKNSATETLYCVASNSTVGECFNQHCVVDCVDSGAEKACDGCIHNRGGSCKTHNDQVAPEAYNTGQHLAQCSNSGICTVVACLDCYTHNMTCANDTPPCVCGAKEDECDETLFECINGQTCGTVDCSDSQLGQDCTACAAGRPRVSGKICVASAGKEGKCTSDGSCSICGVCETHKMKCDTDNQNCLCGDTPCDWSYQKCENNKCVSAVVNCTMSTIGAQCSGCTEQGAESMGKVCAASDGSFGECSLDGNCSICGVCTANGMQCDEDAQKCSCGGTQCDWRRNTCVDNTCVPEIAACPENEIGTECPQCVDDDDRMIGKVCKAQNGNEGECTDDGQCSVCGKCNASKMQCDVLAQECTCGGTQCDVNSDLCIAGQCVVNCQSASLDPTNGACPACNSRNGESCQARGDRDGTVDSQCNQDGFCAVNCTMAVGNEICDACKNYDGGICEGRSGTGNCAQPSASSEDMLCMIECSGEQCTQCGKNGDIACRISESEDARLCDSIGLCSVECPRGKSECAPCGGHVGSKCKKLGGASGVCEATNDGTIACIFDCTAVKGEAACTACDGNENEACTAIGGHPGTCVGDGQNSNCRVQCSSDTRCPECAQNEGGACVSLNGDITGICAVNAKGVGICTVNCTHVDTRAAGRHYCIATNTTVGECFSQHCVVDCVSSGIGNPCPGCDKNYAGKCKTNEMQVATSSDISKLSQCSSTGICTLLECEDCTRNNMTCVDNQLLCMCGSKKEACDSTLLVCHDGERCGPVDCTNTRIGDQCSPCAATTADVRFVGRMCDARHGKKGKCTSDGKCSVCDLCVENGMQCDVANQACTCGSNRCDWTYQTCTNGTCRTVAPINCTATPIGDKCPSCRAEAELLGHNTIGKMCLADGSDEGACTFDGKCSVCGVCATKGMQCNVVVQKCMCVGSDALCDWTSNECTADGVCNPVSVDCTAHPVGRDCPGCAVAGQNTIGEACHARNAQKGECTAEGTCSLCGVCTDKNMECAESKQECICGGKLCDWTRNACTNDGTCVPESANCAQSNLGAKCAECRRDSGSFLGKLCIAKNGAKGKCTSDGECSVCGLCGEHKMQCNALDQRCVCGNEECAWDSHKCEIDVDGMERCKPDIINCTAGKIGKSCPQCTMTHSIWVDGKQCNAMGTDGTVVLGKCAPPGVCSICQHCLENNMQCDAERQQCLCNDMACDPTTGHHVCRNDTCVNALCDMTCPAQGMECDSKGTSVCVCNGQECCGDNDVCKWQDHTCELKAVGGATPGCVPNVERSLTVEGTVVTVAETFWATFTLLPATQQANLTAPYEINPSNLQHATVQDATNTQTLQFAKGQATVRRKLVIIEPNSPLSIVTLVGDVDDGRTLGNVSVSFFNATSHMVTIIGRCRTFKCSMHGGVNDPNKADAVCPKTPSEKPGCTPEFCCSTCSSFSCDAEKPKGGYVRNATATNTKCLVDTKESYGGTKTKGCTAHQCCSSTCLSYNCSAQGLEANTTALQEICDHIDDSTLHEQQGTTCTKAQCCVVPMVTCSSESFDCAALNPPQKLNASSLNDPCPSGACNATDCCINTCGNSFVCGEDLVVRQDAINDECVAGRGGCTQEQCCETTCAVFDCAESGDFVHKPNANSMTCGDGDCTVTTCCDQCMHHGIIYEKAWNSKFKYNFLWQCAEECRNTTRCDRFQWSEPATAYATAPPITGIAPYTECSLVGKDATITRTSTDTSRRYSSGRELCGEHVNVDVLVMKNDSKNGTAAEVSATTDAIIFDKHEAKNNRTINIYSHVTPCKSGHFILRATATNRKNYYVTFGRITEEQAKRGERWEYVRRWSAHQDGTYMFATHEDFTTVEIADAAEKARWIDHVTREGLKGMYFGTIAITNTFKNTLRQRMNVTLACGSEPTTTPKEPNTTTGATSTATGTMAPSTTAPGTTATGATSTAAGTMAPGTAATSTMAPSTTSTTTATMTPGTTSTGTMAPGTTSTTTGTMAPGTTAAGTMEPSTTATGTMAPDATSTTTGTMVSTTISTTTIPEHVTCASFNCLVSEMHTHKPGASTTLCPDRECTLEQCCAVTCASFDCSVGERHAPMPNANTTMCTDGECTLEQCCVECVRHNVVYDKAWKSRFHYNFAWQCADECTNTKHCDKYLWSEPASVSKLATLPLRGIAAHTECSFVPKGAKMKKASDDTRRYLSSGISCGEHVNVDVVVTRRGMVRRSNGTVNATSRMLIYDKPEADNNRTVNVSAHVTPCASGEFILQASATSSRQFYVAFGRITNKGAELGKGWEYVRKLNAMKEQKYMFATQKSLRTEEVFGAAKKARWTNQVKREKLKGMYFGTITIKQEPNNPWNHRMNVTLRCGGIDTKKTLGTAKI